jgi:hypothetical protein
MRSLARSSGLAIAAVCFAACSSSAVSPSADSGSGATPTGDDASSGPGDQGGDAAAVPDVGAGSSSSGGGAGSGSSSGTGSSSSGAAVVDASTADVRDASPAAKDGSADAGKATTTADASVVAPYKGVANSACNDLTTLTTSWWYNWETSPGSCKVGAFVPMVWGHTGSEQTATGIANEVKSAVSGGWGTVLGFNEPDNTGQSNISVATAISLWPAFLQTGARIGSPATQGNSTGLTWIQSFMSQVNADTTGTLHVDFIATHWYGWNAGSCDAAAANLDSWLKQIEAIPGNRPIWLTEWGCLNLSNPTPAVVQAFYQGAIVMFAKHPRLERYGWYPWTTNNELVDTTDALTSLGTVFAAAPTTK